MARRGEGLPSHAELRARLSEITRPISSRESTPGDVIMGAEGQLIAASSGRPQTATMTVDELQRRCDALLEEDEGPAAKQQAAVAARVAAAAAAASKTARRGKKKSKGIKVGKSRR